MLALLATSAIVTAMEATLPEAAEGRIIVRRPTPRYPNGELALRMEVMAPKYMGPPVRLPKSGTEYLAPELVNVNEQNKDLRQQLMSAAARISSDSKQNDALRRKLMATAERLMHATQQITLLEQQAHAARQDIHMRTASAKIVWEAFLEQKKTIKDLQATVEGYKEVIEATAVGVTSYLASQPAPVKRKTTMEPEAAASETESEEEVSPSTKARRTMAQPNE